MSRKIVRLTWLLVAAITCSIAQPLVAQSLPTGVRVVDPSATAGSNNGSSWANAFTTLEGAIGAAHTNSAITEIWVKTGTYKPTYEPVSGSRYRTFRMKSGLAIYGGFAGGETDQDDRDSVANPTILSGDLAGNDTSNFGNRGDNAYHVVTAARVDPTALIDGFTIKGGNADDAPAIESAQTSESGGGIAIYASAGDQGPGIASHPVIVRCTFEDNLAVRGGAAYMFAGRSSQANFWNCTFRNNKAEIGACFYNDDDGSQATNASPGFYNCLFIHNLATTAGSAIYSEAYPNQSIKNCTITENDSEGTSGAVVHLGANTAPGTEGSVGVTSSIIYGNTADGTETVAWQIVAEDARRIVRYSDMKNYSNGTGDTGNITSNPQFVDPSSNDFTLDCSSPCINGGDDTLVEVDDYDLAQDGSSTATYHWTPDLALQARLVGNAGYTRVDMGCYEVQPTESCEGDIALWPCTDGVIGQDDLTEINLGWGPCPYPGELCPGDIDHDGAVEIDDWTVVTQGWGNCPGSFTGGSEGPTPQEIVATWIEMEVINESLLAALIEAGFFN